MLDYIAITKFNDFIFCPYSLYLHSIYEGFNDQVFHEEKQIKGKLTHERLDQAKYSTRSGHFQGKTVYSEKLHVLGKIDFFDSKEGILRERKYHLNKVFEGHKLQLYAQQFALKEMGYQVKTLSLYSLSDNKTYSLALGGMTEYLAIFKLSLQMRQWTPETYHLPNEHKCRCCIYRTLCERSLAYDQS